MSSPDPANVDKAEAKLAKTSSNEEEDGKEVAMEEEDGEEEEEKMEKITARRLKIHETPTYLCDWLQVTLPASSMYKQHFNPRINFQDETELLVVAPLGRGGNGEVWFAITPDTERCCAVKFFFKDKGCQQTIFDLADRERKNWDKVYGNDDNLPKCHVGQLCDDTNHSYLCMPYICQVPQRMWPMIAMPFMGGDVGLKSAFAKFVAAGLKQGSIRWAHVGFFPKGSGTGDEEDSNVLELYIFDLGRMEEFQDGEDTDAWVQEALKTLVDAIPPFPSIFDMGQLQRELQLEGHFREHLFR